MALCLCERIILGYGQGLFCEMIIGGYGQCLLWRGL
jgi:hypothetical protein